MLAGQQIPLAQQAGSAAGVARGGAALCPGKARAAPSALCSAAFLVNSPSAHICAPVSPPQRASSRPGIMAWLRMTGLSRLGLQSSQYSRASMFTCKGGTDGRDAAITSGSCASAAPRPIRRGMGPDAGRQAAAHVRQGRSFRPAPVLGLTLRWSIPSWQMSACRQGGTTGAGAGAVNASSEAARGLPALHSARAGWLGPQRGTLRAP